MKTSEELLEEYYNNLKETLKREGELTDIDLLFCKPKLNAIIDTSEELNELNFLRAFNLVKLQFRKGSIGARSLPAVARRNLSKLSKRGYKINDVKKAVEAMYFEDGKGLSWAFRTGNDTPAHLLREENFERYLNIYEHGTTTEQAGANADAKNIDAKKRILGIGG